MTAIQVPNAMIWPRDLSANAVPASRTFPLQSNGPAAFVKLVSFRTNTIVSLQICIIISNFAVVNECQYPHLNDCHQNAQCIDLEDGYQCRCNQGFKDLRVERPGRLCKQMVNECARPELNSCDKNAKCADEEDGYKCECKPGYADVSPSPNLPGRACRPVVNECLDLKLNDCDPRAKCIDLAGKHQ